MSLFSLIKDHILIGGAGSIAATGLLVLLVVSGGLSAGQLTVDPVLFFSIAVAAACTGLGVYALNAYHDREVDRINKPGVDLFLQVELLLVTLSDMRFT